MNNPIIQAKATDQSSKQWQMVNRFVHHDDRDKTHLMSKSRTLRVRERVALGNPKNNIVKRFLWTAH